MSKPLIERQLEQQFLSLNSLLQQGQQQLGQCPMRRPSWQADFQLGDALADLWYQPGQDGRSTRDYYGLVWLNADQLALVTAINEQKTALHQQILALKKHHPKQSQWSDLLRHRLPSVQGPLSRLGLSRLHLKQLLRQLPIASAPLAKVQFSWYSSGRSIKKFSYSQALELVAAMSDQQPQKERYWQKLAALPSGTPLAQVQKQAPLLRANLFFSQGSREARNLSLPLTISEQQLDSIAFRYPEEAVAPARQRAVRSDLKISETAYIEELRLHLYL